MPALPLSRGVKLLMSAAEAGSPLRQLQDLLHQSLRTSQVKQALGDLHSTGADRYQMSLKLATLVIDGQISPKPRSRFACLVDAWKAGWADQVSPDLQALRKQQDAECRRARLAYQPTITTARPLDHIQAQALHLNEDRVAAALKYSQNPSIENEHQLIGVSSYIKGCRTSGNCWTLAKVLQHQLPAFPMDRVGSSGTSKSPTPTREHKPDQVLPWSAFVPAALQWVAALPATRPVFSVPLMGGMPLASKGGLMSMIASQLFYPLRCISGKVPPLPEMEFGPPNHVTSSQITGEADAVCAVGPLRCVKVVFEAETSRVMLIPDGNIVKAFKAALTMAKAADAADTAATKALQASSAAAKAYTASAAAGVAASVAASTAVSAATSATASRVKAAKAAKRAAIMAIKAASKAVEATEAAEVAKMAAVALEPAAAEAAAQTPWQSLAHARALVNVVAQLHTYMQLVPLGVLITDTQLFCCYNGDDNILCFSPGIAVGQPAEQHLLAQETRDMLVASHSTGGLTAMAALLYLAAGVPGALPLACPGQPLPVQAVVEAAAVPGLQAAAPVEAAAYYCAGVLLARSLHHSDLQLSRVIGKGTTATVMEGLYKGRPIADKVADVLKRPEALAKLQKEVVMYSRMASIQGRFVPALLAHGQLSIPQYCLCFGLEGQSLESAQYFTEDELQTGIEALHQVHAAGVLHGDIALRNLLLTRSIPRRLVVADFGNATAVSCHDPRLEVEQFALQRLLNELRGRGTPP